MTDPDTRAAREALVADWIAAWNAHDLDRIVAHYADPLTFVLDAVGKVVAANVAYGDAAAGARFIPG